MKGLLKALLSAFLLFSPNGITVPQSMQTKEYINEIQYITDPNQFTRVVGEKLFSKLKSMQHKIKNDLTF